MRSLLIHAGAGKTGTTALQVFFEEHRDWLAGHGLHYPTGPTPPSGGSGIISGNGVWLYRYLTDGRFGDEFWAQLRDAPPELDVLISSELLAHGTPERITALKADLAREGFELKVVYLVRNPDAWMLSAYQQLVKRHGLAKTFEEFCDWYPLEFPRTIKKYEAIIGDNLRVLSYEAGKRDLVPYFARTVLGIAEPPPPSQVDSINRSLTRLELEVLQGANALLSGTGLTDNAIGARIGPISDRLVAGFPIIDSADRFSEPMPERAVEQWRPEVAAINERLSEGELEFSVARTSAPLSPNERGLARMLAVLIADQVQGRRPGAGAPAAKAPAAQASAASARPTADELANDLAAIKNSTSWRITAPLRRVVSAWRGRGGPTDS